MAEQDPSQTPYFKMMEIAGPIRNRMFFGRSLSDMPKQKIAKITKHLNAIKAVIAEHDEDMAEIYMKQTKEKLNALVDTVADICERWLAKSQKKEKEPKA